MSRIDYMRQWRADNPAKTLIINVRSRAKREGHTFTLTDADIEMPSHCPVLGIELKAGSGQGAKLDSTPTLRMLDPTLGYVPGNVMVLSMAAYKTRPLQGAGPTDAELHDIALELLRKVAAFGVTPGAVAELVACFKRIRA